MKLIEAPVCFRDDAVPGREIQEYIGKISTKDDVLSIAELTFPEGWSQPPQRPLFDEYSVVLEGTLYVDTESVGTVIVRPGQGILTRKEERVRYRTPKPGGAKWISVCVPAFCPELAQREKTDVWTDPTDVSEGLNSGLNRDRVVFSAMPTVLLGTGQNTRQVDEYFGHFVGNSTQISIAKSLTWQGCVSEFRQTEDDQYVLVLQGEALVRTQPKGDWTVAENQMIVIKRHEWFQYLIPKPGETMCMLICRPARLIDADFDVQESENDEIVIMSATPSPSGT